MKSILEYFKLYVFFQKFDQLFKENEQLLAKLNDSEKKITKAKVYIKEKVYLDIFYLLNLFLLCFQKKLECWIERYAR